MAVLVTGAAGYIGSHATKRLLADGFTVVGVDNLYRGNIEAIEQLQRAYPGKLTFVEEDIANKFAITALLSEHTVETVMHFAALAYVGESVTEPLEYYATNTAGALALIRACDKAGVTRFIFSSTAATYGEPPESEIPIKETCPQAPINPYGMSKLATERILFDWAHARSLAGEPVGVAALRYFNVAGCDREGLLGEDHEPETHLIPVILQAAMGVREKIAIFGTDYPTHDGTCLRDYIHVEDLVDAHVAVMNAIKPGETRRYNLGIGSPYSVREIVNAVRRVTGREFKVVEEARREGDPPSLYADPEAIKRDLGWSASITDIDEIIASAWSWFESHPRGYTASAV